MKRSNVFDGLAEKYDGWFEKHKAVYLTEIEVLKKLVPERGDGLEIGVGTGRFARPLGIKTGVDPSADVLEFAEKRGIKVYRAPGEELPFDEASFDYVLLMMTLCFVEDPVKVLSETARVLRKNGEIIAAVIDRESYLGKLYKKKDNSPFYKHARFYTVAEIKDLLREAGFGKFKIYQSLFGNPFRLKSIDRIESGFGRGSFAALSAKKL